MDDGVHAIDMVTIGTHGNNCNSQGSQTSSEDPRTSSGSETEFRGLLCKARLKMINNTEERKAQAIGRSDEGDQEESDDYDNIYINLQPRPKAIGQTEHA